MLVAVALEVVFVGDAGTGNSVAGVAAAPKASIEGDGCSPSVGVGVESVSDRVLSLILARVLSETRLSLTESLPTSRATWTTMARSRPGAGLLGE